MPSEERPWVVYGALVANLVIAAAKFTAAFISGSSAMLAEGIHSVIDTGNEILLLVGLARARRKPDRLHPFGYGKELYFWSLLVAMLLFGIGGGMSVYEGVRAFLHPAPHRTSWWNYLVLGISLASEGTSWLIATHQLRREYPDETLWQAVRRSKDPSKFVVVGEDSAAIGGVLVAFAGILAGQLSGSAAPDAAASIVIGLILCATAVGLVMETKELLIGESADPHLVGEIERLARAQDWICSVSSPLTMQFGPRQVLVNLDVVVRAGAHDATLIASIDQLESTIRAQLPQVRRIYISPRRAGADEQCA
jgi:cation diffusion facilitator family transporter